MILASTQCRINIQSHVVALICLNVGRKCQIETCRAQDEVRRLRTAVTVVLSTIPFSQEYNKIKMEESAYKQEKYEKAHQSTLTTCCSMMKYGTYRTIFKIYFDFVTQLDQKRLMSLITVLCP